MYAQNRKGLFRRMRVGQAVLLLGQTTWQKMTSAICGRKRCSVDKQQIPTKEF
jgi:hypothetical protein